MYLEGADKKPQLVGHTEVSKHNLDPDFRQTIQMEYYFNRVQNILIYAYDANESIVGKVTELVVVGDRKENFLGSARSSLTKLMGSPGGVTKLNLTRDGSLYEGTVVVFVDKAKGDAELSTKITWSWAGLKLKDKDWFSKSDPFASFYRQDSETNRLLVYKTETIKDNLNPRWHPWSTTS